MPGSEPACANVVLPGSVFPIMPGLARTAMSEEAREHLPFVQKLFDEGREITPEIVARLVLTLASGAADALSGHLFSASDHLKEKFAGLNKCKGMSCTC